MLMMMTIPPNINASSDISAVQADARPAQISADLLTLLVCPLTRSGLIYDKQDARLISLQARLAYPIKGQVPIMLEEAAQPLSEEEEARFAKNPPPPSNTLLRFSSPFGHAQAFDR